MTPPSAIARGASLDVPLGELILAVNCNDGGCGRSPVGAVCARASRLRRHIGDDTGERHDWERHAGERHA